MSKDVWIFGKGPSIDIYDFSKAGPFRVGINDAALIVPKLWAASSSSLGQLERFSKLLNEDILVLYPKIYEGKVGPFKVQYMWGDEGIFTNASSINTVELMWHFGFRTMHMVGFDSYSGNSDYGKSIWKVSKSEPDTLKSYESIIVRLIQVAEKKGIELIWEHLFL